VKLHMNPVLEREMKERVRGVRSAVMLTAFLALLALIVQVVYWTQTRQSTNNPFASPQAISSARTGQMLFDVLVFAIVVLLCFIVPGMAAASIAGERDRQTLVPLQITLLRPATILFGKLSASLAYLMLLVVAASPFLAISFVFGGVTIGSVLKALVAIVFVAAVLGAISVFCSVVFRRVQSATVAAQFLVFALLLGSPIVYGVQHVVFQRTDGQPSALRDNKAVLTLNPVVFVADLVHGDTSNGASTPLAAIKRGVAGNGISNAIGGGFGGGPNGFSVDGNGNVVNGPGSRASVPFWVWCVVVQGSLGALAFWAATRRLRTPSMRGSDR
jgi:ABC-type transport system involved in multi-copper enzyme maturation permease subunit